MWAILSGIEGNLQAYHGVINDILGQKMSVEEIYILGDIIGISENNEALVKEIRHPHHNIPIRVCRGWWEEQCIILHSLHSTADPVELINKYGVEASKKLWDCVSRETVEWLRNLDFGFVEFDCLLIHGSSVNISEVLTPDTSPWIILDRLNRVNVNYLFCGRSSQIFDYELQSGFITSAVMSLDNKSISEVQEFTKKRLIGVGNIGKTANTASYTLYNPYNNQLKFTQINY
ncbi:serine/threonine protein phosphatase [Geminocystis sp. NIES-3708]|uniref:metallophosphatase n=1 Tax=Geminocystis sp. NIES-3708 TaxID=1615909 RepID=UPI0005FC78B8|nr:metallophosphatase [Geminocystis sp. NIES-3708]BAQ62547.1 serine/threonine protein phosphatase [Geminocystis sp. NIES-3708]